MTQCGNGFSEKLLWKVKLNVLMDRKLVTKDMILFVISSCSLCKSKKCEMKIKAFNILMRGKLVFISMDI